jgi:hypothetical protein
MSPVTIDWDQREFDPVEVVAGTIRNSYPYMQLFIIEYQEMETVLSYVKTATY